VHSRRIEADQALDRMKVAEAGRKLRTRTALWARSCRLMPTTRPIMKELTCFSPVLRLAGGCESSAQLIRKGSGPPNSRASQTCVGDDAGGIQLAMAGIFGRPAELNHLRLRRCR
jgi:hypothetical protein